MFKRRLAWVLAVGLGVGLLGSAGCAGEKERQQEYYRKALEHYEAGNYDKASVEIRNALQINGDFPDGRYLHALIYEKDQNWQQLWANLNLVLELDPTHVKALIKISQLEFMNEMYDDVLKNMGTVLQREPENPDAHMLLGSVYVKQGKLDEAVTEANLALKAKPGHVGAISVLTEVYKTTNPDLALKIIGEEIAQVEQKAVLGMLKIDVLISNQRIDDAVAAYRELIASYPENLLFHYRLITLLQEHGRNTEAEDQLRSVVKAKPENTELKLWLAEFIANQKDLDRAESELKAFLKAQPDVVELHMALARVHAAKGDKASAEQVYRKIIDQHGINSFGLEARNALAELYFSQGNEKTGTEILDEIFEIENENSRALITRARLSLSKGLPKDAISDLRTVAKNQAEPIEALMMLGSAHEMEGDLELALDNYRQVITLKPGEVAALSKAARLEMNFNNPAAAEGLLKTALKLQPGNPQITSLLVENYARRKQWDEGLKFAEVMIDAEDKKVAALGLYVKGRLLSEKGDLQAAETALRRCLEIQPDAIEALNALSKLLVKQGQIEETKQFLSDHLKQHPGHIHAAERLGELLLSDDVFSALTFYKSQVEAHPEALNLTIGLGQAYEANQLPQKALETYEAGLTLAPKNAVLAVMLAGQYQRQGNWVRAESLYKQALRNDPESKIAANNLATLYLDELNTPDNRDAAESLGKLLRGSQHPIFLDTLGWISYHRGNIPGAISYLKSAIATGNAPPEAHYHIAKAYLSDKKPEEARASLASLQALQVEPALAQKALALLQEIEAAPAG
ncbi:MAG: tetratricopeptide repeat protein [Hahellaceae bacterium]|nr:tetratricopeptide repeat protein [Hahellaceae bacterium]